MLRAVDDAIIHRNIALNKRVTTQHAHVTNIAKSTIK